MFYVGQMALSSALLLSSHLWQTRWPTRCYSCGSDPAFYLAASMNFPAAALRGLWFRAYLGFPAMAGYVLANDGYMKAALGAAELAKEKVALLAAMAGNFAGGDPEYNVRIDVPSAKAVFERCRRPSCLAASKSGASCSIPRPALSTASPTRPRTRSRRLIGRIPECPRTGRLGI